MKLHILTCVCCRGVVEYDAEGFTKLTLLLMWKDFCFLVHGKKLERHSCTHTGLFFKMWCHYLTILILGFFSAFLLLCSSSLCSGSAAVLPQGPAHPHLPVCVPLHQQRSALFSGAEVISLQPTLGRQWDGQESKVSRACSMMTIHLCGYLKKQVIHISIFCIFKCWSLRRYICDFKNWRSSLI